MTPLPALWSLQWGSDGELSPLDRHDLAQSLHLPGLRPLPGESNPATSPPERGSRGRSRCCIISYR